MEANPLLPSEASRCERLTRKKWPLVAFILVVLLTIWATVKETTIDDRNQPNVLVWTFASPNAPLMYLYSAGNNKSLHLFVYASTGKNKLCVNPKVLPFHSLLLHADYEASNPSDFQSFLYEWVQLHPEYKHAQVWLIGHDVDFLGQIGFSIVQHNFNKPSSSFVNLAGLVFTSKIQWSCNEYNAIAASPSKKVGQLLDAGVHVIFSDSSMSTITLAAQALPWSGQRAFIALDSTSDHCITDSCSNKLQSYKNLIALQNLEDEFIVENYITNSIES
ncbi:hypothetical protein THRCLA_03056 [Thraustotheca clavata]|uniref:Uncharacterized protein n=1 Tax=Thraustotheca clavata TaxID=74557 RepID=A0A1W0A364_9STRA|nr:hypothetical protein THRCLA_03056 [Thraustotheca clavata]